MVVVVAWRVGKHKVVYGNPIATVSDHSYCSEGISTNKKCEGMNREEYSVDVEENKD